LVLALHRLAPHSYLTSRTGSHRPRGLICFSHGSLFIWRHFHGNVSASLFNPSHTDLLFNWCAASSSDSSSSSSSREIKCPKCHGPFQVPLKGVEDLPINYTAGVVTASIKKESVDPNHVVCELCEENEATVKCSNCAQFQCDSCKKIHPKAKSSSQHQFVAIDEALKEGSASSTSRILYCQKHPHLEVNSYCKTDQTALCAECAVDFHSGHNVDRLVNISKGFKDTISTLVNKVRILSFSLFSNLKTNPLLGEGP